MTGTWTIQPNERVCAGCGTTFLGRGRAKWCSESCRRHTLYSGECVDCGAPTYSGNVLPPKRCRACDGLLCGPRQREAFLAHKTTIEALWADGWTAREIADFMGWKVKNPGTSISMLRNQRGYNLPHRRTPEQLARLGVGAAERLAKARAVYREQRAA